MTSMSDEASTDGKSSRHFCNAVVDHGQDNALRQEGEEQIRRTSMIQAITNAHEQCSTNGASDGNQLDLTVSQMSLQLVAVIGGKAFSQVLAGVRRRVATFFFVAAENAHDVEYSSIPLLSPDCLSGRHEEEAKIMGVRRQSMIYTIQLDAEAQAITRSVRFKVWRAAGRCNWRLRWKMLLRAAPQPVRISCA